MSVESSIRYGNEGPHRYVFTGGSAQHYGSPHPFEDHGVDWRWYRLWEDENPNPAWVEGYAKEDFEAWFERSHRMRKICWAQDRFPQLRLMDWDPDGEDMTALLRLVSRHVCGVCGRIDDPGCTEGC
jgi:hypothetical protein